MSLLIPRTSLLTSLLLVAWLLTLWSNLSGVHAYIPASPINDTGIVTNGSDSSQASKLNLMWYGGVHSEDVSYQLVGAGTNGTSKGVLMRFSEEHLSNDTTMTPWIALVSCDANATDASDVDDVFTLARDRGAVAALLYSNYSERCQINPEYADPANFDQVMDIFATPRLSASRMILLEYSAINDTRYHKFNATLLNQTAEVVNETLASGNITTPNYIFATLRAYNATGDVADSNDGGTLSNNGGSGSGSSSSKSSLAMIILYVITGCVSALFCVVIITGAIRAIRHPERYGPRGTIYGAPGSYGSPQSRARGLTRAILDTFPVVKFGRVDEPVQAGVQKDVESAASVPDHSQAKTDVDELELRELPAMSMVTTGLPENERRSGERNNTQEDQRGSHDMEYSAGAIPRPRLARATPREVSTASGFGTDLVPDAIGRETCPICIVDFEEGDDLRVLPCEGHHRFHQQCVDQWLLELSTSCPLCRQDFHTLETMMSNDGHDDNDQLEPPPPIGSRPLSSAGARFSRYLRLARRRRRDNTENVHGYDPTNPPMPMAPHTTL